jgi:hypothetical protein
MVTLSIINPADLKDPGIYVDSNYNYETEILFNPDDIKWMFYGSPYQHFILNGGGIKVKYGFKYSWGYIKSISNPNIKYDVIYGLLIDRIDSDLDIDYSSDSDFDFEPKSKFEFDNEDNEDYEDYDNNEVGTNTKLLYTKNKKIDKLKRTENFDKCEIFVDEFNRMDFESEFDSNKIKYKFIGNPINKFHGYGFNYADGILIPIDNPDIKLRLFDGKITAN